VGENTAQCVVEGSVTVPGEKPEIGRALRVKAVPKITGYDVMEGRATFEGALDIDLLYASFTEVESSGQGEEPELVLEERLEQVSFARAVSFSFPLDVPGAESGMLAQVGVTVDSVGFEVLSDQRTVEIDTVLAFSAQVKRIDEYKLATRVIAAENIEMEHVDVRLHGGSTVGRAQANVVGLLSFGGRTLPEQVLDLAIRPSATAVKVVDGAAEVHGALSCSLLYTADEVGAASAEWPEAISFEARVPLPDTPDQTKAEAEVTVTDAQWRRVEIEETRGVEVEATLLVTVQTDAVGQIGIVTGITAEGPATVAVRTEPITLQEAVGEVSTTVKVGATLELPTGSAPIERVLAAEGKARVEDVHVLGDKVAVEGMAGVNLVYVGRSGDATSLATTAWPAGVPFEIEVALPGAEPGLERRVEVKVDRVAVDLINRETVDAALELQVRIALTRQVELQAVVEAVEVPAPEPNPPTFTFVVLQEGDTLWQMAQRYHTDIASLLRANKWLDDETTALPAGSKLCIIRPGRQ
jgi:LysM repeat protein